MPITRTAWTDDDGTGTTGTIINNAQKTSLYDQIDAFVEGGQIAFPATQNASSNANTLDDYEEGSWTPVLGGSGGTSGQAYSVQYGRYVKIGRLVHVQGFFTLTTLGTITGNAQIQGLPFTVENVSNGFSALAVSSWAGMTSTIVWMGMLVTANTTIAEVRLATAAATSVSIGAQANFSNTTAIAFSGSYRASA